LQARLTGTSAAEPAVFRTDLKAISAEIYDVEELTRGQRATARIQLNQISWAADFLPVPRDRDAFETVRHKPAGPFKV
jgi:hypothetical protein